MAGPIRKLGHRVASWDEAVVVSTTTPPRPERATARAAQGTARATWPSLRGDKVSTEPSWNLRVDVAQRVALECVDERGTACPIDTVFGYDRRDPYAVTITFCTPDGALPWFFARELLVVGVGTPAGEGDVAVWPSVSPQGRAVLMIELSSPDGRLLTQAPAGHVHRFLTRTLALVPSGTESDHLDLDGLVDQLLTR